jgi:hypothetical protein
MRSGITQIVRLVHAALGDALMACYLMYVDDTPLWLATSMEEVVALSAPYITDRRALRVAIKPVLEPPREWTYDYSGQRWVDLPDRTVS